MARPFDLITFDFDGVLLHNTFNEILLESFRAVGLRWPTAGERALARFIHEYYGTGQAARERLEHEGARFWQVANRRFAEVLGAEPWDDALGVAISEIFPLTPPHFFHETGLHEMLHALRAEGYALAMLTNRDAKVYELGRTWEMLRHFDFIGTSETVGKAKPDPALYHHIAAHFGVAPERALHIGDNPYADVVGAQAAGWHALLIDPDDLFPDWPVPRLRMLVELPAWLEGKVEG